MDKAFRLEIKQNLKGAGSMVEKTVEAYKQRSTDILPIYISMAFGKMT